MLLCASEVNFILAEAALRDWDLSGLQRVTVTYSTVAATLGDMTVTRVPIGSQSAGFFYEEGIRRSLERWNVAEADINAYVNNNTRMPLPHYIDPADERNNYTSRMTDPEVYTIAWRDDVSKEKQLERIMTQKWIALFNNANEIWSDHRRTGYPKLHFNLKNDSNEVWGTIGDDEFLKRMPFVQRERQNNPAWQTNSALLGSGGDRISTALWIHTPQVNHIAPNNNLPD
jgi:hypothetical protein